MNLLEALATGKPLKRKTWGTFVHKLIDRGNCVALTNKDETDFIFLCSEDLTATDYEVKEETKEFTFSEIAEALGKVVIQDSRYDLRMGNIENLYAFFVHAGLKKALGFKD